ncbi:MAG: DNA methyltransferase [Silicimonas sp.]
MAKDHAKRQNQQSEQSHALQENGDISGKPPGTLAIPRHLEYVATVKLTPNARNARTHSKRQIRQIAESVRQFGFNNPILVDDSYEVIAGHGRLLAAKDLGIPEVPVVCLSHLSDAEKRAYVLADNKIALNAGWDGELLAAELGDLAALLPEIDLDLELTGFDTGEIDIILTDFEDPESSPDKEDDVPTPSETAVSRHGDIWQMGPHRVLCGDVRNPEGVAALWAGERADLIITDPPFNVRVQGHVGGRGKTKHSEFAFASGEMSDDEYRKFLRDSIGVMADHSKDGALLYLFMDWRHIELLLSVGRELGLSLKNICVWNKTTPGQGSFYRSAHELVAVFAKPGQPTTNNVQLGRYGRNRTNVWSYPGVNTFQAGKGGDLALHPTVKPVAMISEAIKDASGRGEAVFDPFLGSGTTLLAAEKVGRKCYGVEYEPRYVDVAIRRWQEMTGKDALLAHRQGEAAAGIGSSFDELRASDCSKEEAEK